MGNTSSNFGLFLGSIIGGIIMGPITGGASIVAISSLAGAGVGFTGAVVNGALERHSENPEKDILIGTGCGILGPVCGGASKLGADVAFSIGGDIAGKSIGVGYTSISGEKPEPFIGNPDKIIIERIKSKEKEKIEKYKKDEDKQILNKNINMSHRPPLFKSDFKLLSIKRKNNTEISSIKSLQNDLAFKAFMWVSYDLKVHKRLERAKESIVKIIVAFGHIAKEYRNARIGGASKSIGIATALDSKIDIYQIIGEFHTVFKEFQENKRIHEDLIEISNKHFNKIIKELKDDDKISDKIMDLSKYKTKSEVKDYEIISNFLSSLRSGIIY